MEARDFQIWACIWYPCSSFRIKMEPENQRLRLIKCLTDEEEPDFLPLVNQYIDEKLLQKVMQENQDRLMDGAKFLKPLPS